MSNFLDRFVQQAAAYRMCETCQHKAIQSINAMSRQAVAAREVEAARDRGDRAAAKLREMAAGAESTLSLTLCCRTCRSKAALIVRRLAEKSG